MSKNKNNEEEQNILHKLSSNNPIIIKETLIELREKGNSKYIPFLFKLLQKHHNSNISTSIKNFISDIKESSIKTTLIACLKDESYNNIKKDLLTICWESRFDFSDNLELFVDILIEDDFITAFEALTVIENLNSDISEVFRNKQIIRLKDAILRSDKNKQQLIHDAIHIIPKIKHSKL